MPFTLVLAVLLLARVAWNWKKRKPVAAPVARAVAAAD
jgi:hypothetical protein